MANLGLVLLVFGFVCACLASLALAFFICQHDLRGRDAASVMVMRSSPDELPIFVHALLGAAGSIILVSIILAVMMVAAFSEEDRIATFDQRFGAAITRGVKSSSEDVAAVTEVPSRKRKPSHRRKHRRHR